MEKSSKVRPKLWCRLLNTNLLSIKFKLQNLAHEIQVSLKPILELFSSQDNPQKLQPFWFPGAKSSLPRLQHLLLQPSLKLPNKVQLRIKCCIICFKRLTKCNSRTQRRLSSMQTKERLRRRLQFKNFRILQLIKFTIRLCQKLNYLKPCVHQPSKSQGDYSPRIQPLIKNSKQMSTTNRTLILPIKTLHPWSSLVNLKKSTATTI